MMSSAQVVEMSVTITDNSPFQDHIYLDDHTSGYAIDFTLSQNITFYMRSIAMRLRT